MARRQKVAFSAEQCRSFVDNANPHQWLLVADSLHQQAVALRSRHGRSMLTLRERGRAPTSWDETNRATFLLCAFALENALKGLIVFEHPQWIADGYLAAEICTHKLTELRKRTALVPARLRDRWVLETFETGNESWMRYPCGRRADDIQAEGHLHGRLWNGYLRVIGTYGKLLVRLLGKGWNGPMGWYGRWEIHGPWLSGDEPQPISPASSAHIRPLALNGLGAPRGG